MDSIGWNDVQIFVSGDLTEERIETLLSSGGCADSFGVGTALSTSADSPSVGVIYKLVEVQFEDHVRSTAKFSAEKKTYPGRKQVFRFRGEDGMLSHDVIALESEVFPGAEPLLVQVMRGGQRLPVAAEAPAIAVKSAQSRFLVGRRRLPPRFLTLGPASQPFPVQYSTQLEELSDQIRHAFVPAPAHKPAGTKRNAVSAQVVFWEVDVQQDFMRPDGRLYVPGSEKIIPNVNRLVEAARQGQVFLFSETDAHNLDDPEMRQWPPHCIKGTPGADLIPEARASIRLVIPNQQGFALPQDLGAYQQVVLEKNTLDVFDNPNTDPLLARLGSAGSPAIDRNPQFVVFGVATEYCIRYAVDGLRRRGRRVALVSDAIQAIDAAKGQQTLADFQARGATLLTTAEALALLTPPLARSA
jgi:nicotinamidase-related amidase